MKKYALRMMHVVFELKGNTYNMTVTSRDWCRDATGQIWVRCGNCCCKVSKAEPYVSDWIDDLFNERHEDGVDY